MDLEFEELPPLGVFDREEIDREFVESLRSGTKGGGRDPEGAAARRVQLRRLIEGGWTLRELAELAGVSSQAIEQGVTSNR